jgi:hypothetical protein
LRRWNRAARSPARRVDGARWRRTTPRRLSYRRCNERRHPHQLLNDHAQSGKREWWRPEWRSARLSGSRKAEDCSERGSDDISWGWHGLVAPLSDGSAIPNGVAGSRPAHMHEPPLLLIEAPN